MPASNAQGDRPCQTAWLAGGRQLQPGLCRFTATMWPGSAAATTGNDRHLVKGRRLEPQCRRSSCRAAKACARLQPSSTLKVHQESGIARSVGLAYSRRAAGRIRPRSTATWGECSNKTGASLAADADERLVWNRHRGQNWADPNSCMAGVNTCSEPRAAGVVEALQERGQTRSCEVASAAHRPKTAQEKGQSPDETGLCATAHCDGHGLDPDPSAILIARLGLPVRSRDPGVIGWMVRSAPSEFLFRVEADADDCLERAIDGVPPASDDDAAGVPIKLGHDAPP